MQLFGTKGQKFLPCPCGTMGQAQNLATGQNGTGWVFDSLSQDVPRERNERKSVEKMGFFSMISCFRTSFPVLEHSFPVLECLFPILKRPFGTRPFPFFCVLLGK